MQGSPQVTTGGTSPHSASYLHQPNVMQYLLYDFWHYPPENQVSDLEHAAVSCYVFQGLNVTQNFSKHFTTSDI